MHQLSYRYTDEEEATEIEDYILGDEIGGSIGDTGTWYGDTENGYYVRDIEFDVPTSRFDGLRIWLCEKLRGRIERFRYEADVTVPEGTMVEDQ